MAIKRLNEATVRVATANNALILIVLTVLRLFGWRLRGATVENPY